MTEILRRGWPDHGWTLTATGAGPDELRVEHVVPGGEGRRRWVRFPVAGLGHRLAAVDDASPGATVIDRLVAAVDREYGMEAALDGRGPSHAFTAVVNVMDGAGVPYESCTLQAWPPDRKITVRRPAHPVTGLPGRIEIRFGGWPVGSARLAASVTEEYHLHTDSLVRDTFHVYGGYGALDRLPLPAAPVGELCPGIDQVFTGPEAALVRAVLGLLATDGYGPAPGEVRTTVARWFAHAGAQLHSGGHVRTCTVARGPVRGSVRGEDRQVALVLRIDLRPEVAQVWFTEQHHRSAGALLYEVVTPTGAVDTLTAGLDAPEVPGPTAADRLFSWARHLAATGVIGVHLPRGGSAAVIAERFTAAGVPATRRRPERRVPVLSRYDRRTGRHFGLDLVFGATDAPDRAVTVTETWDHPGGTGRDRYRYSATTAYGSLRRVVDLLATRTRTPAAPADASEETLEDLLDAGLQALAHRRELGDSLPARANRDLVRSLFLQAGGPASSHDSTPAAPPR